MILIDEEKAIKMGGGVVARILTACAVPVPESAEECVEEIIQKEENDALRAEIEKHKYDTPF